MFTLEVLGTIYLWFIVMLMTGWGIYDAYEEHMQNKIKNLYKFDELY
jgi:hypothetical protein